MSQNSVILLKDGTFLIHDDNHHVKPTISSILIKNDKIIKIAKNIDPPYGTEVIDCTDKIISPGFVDTHHHGWQTQLKGRHANEQLLEYMVTGTHSHQLQGRH
jgi:cytosine/adenosine deaminase-related metal-dependent hydrolase